MAVVAAVLGSGRVGSVQAAGVVAAAVPFGVFLSLRMSPWLLPLDVLAIGGLLVLGASLAGGGGVVDLPVPSLVVRALHALGHGLPPRDSSPPCPSARCGRTGHSRPPAADLCRRAARCAPAAVPARPRRSNSGPRTLVIVVVALRRLGLYQRAYGLTMLRLYSSVFAVWIGVVLVLAGCGLAGLGAARAWFPPAAIAAGLAMLLGLNIVNPESVMVRHNVGRATRTQKVDPGYLAQLSDDAVPELVRALPQLPEPVRTQMLDTVCAGSRPPFDGWAAANTSRRRAMDARRQVCRPEMARR